ncbi:MAG: 6-bladed beta-propeller [Balneolaceae bacterium]|nr:MAG: 6-bladed beta-propeller [Balneolaceae bacterium]
MLKRNCLIATEPRRDLREPRRSTEPFASLCGSVAILVITTFTACSGAESNTEVPDHILEMENVTVYSSNYLREADTLGFIKDQTFGDSKDLIIGHIGAIAVDEEERLVLYDGHQSAKTIHQFSPTGEYIRQIGREGRGPGEYLSGSQLNMSNNHLLVFDRTLNRHLVYSVETGEHLQTVQIDPANMQSEDPITHLRLGGYHKLNNELFLLSLARAQRYYEDEPGTTRYFITDSEFRELSPEIFRLNRRLENFGEWQGMWIMSFFPFHSRSLLSISESGRIYTAVSDEFFIRELNHEGETIGGFYYPYERKPLNRREALRDIHEREKNIVENMPIPDYWPVLDRMFSDDEDRLWIATETDETEPQKWYVTESNGELVGTFNWPKESVLRMVKNGFLYAVENNSDSGIQQVVRYRIEIGDQDA